MKKTILIIGAVILVLIVVAAVIVSIVASKQRTDVTQQPGTTFPLSSTSPDVNGTGGGMTITAQDGTKIPVKDFIHNGETVADVENPGIYFLAGSVGYCLYDGTCPSGAKSTDYTVSYDTDAGSFTVAILKEPLGASRKEAEEFLASRLGLTTVQLCVLKYSVLVSDSVNESYSGVSNLGFSSCQGATKLP